MNDDDTPILSVRDLSVAFDGFHFDGGEAVQHVSLVGGDRPNVGVG